MTNKKDDEFGPSEIPTTEDALKELEEAIIDAYECSINKSKVFEPKCECGGDASGVGTHAEYCPKHKK